MYDRRLQIEVPNIQQPTETVNEALVTPVNDETITPVPDDIARQVDKEIRMTKSIILDGIKYDLVLGALNMKKEKNLGPLHLPMKFQQIRIQ